MDFRILAFDSPLFLTHSAELVSDPTRTNFRNAKARAATSVASAATPVSRAAMLVSRAATPADVKEYPKFYTFNVDMPGMKPGDIKVQVEDDNVLVISGERKSKEEKEVAKYVRMERRMGKFVGKFRFPVNANIDKISAIYQDGVLTVTVEKLPPSRPKKVKTIEVKMA